MLGSLLKQLSIPQVPVGLPVQSLVRVGASAGVVGSFVWLLGHDLIHPLVIYALELYLTF